MSPLNVRPRAVILSQDATIPWGASGSSHGYHAMLILLDVQTKFIK